MDLFQVLKVLGEQSEDLQGLEGDPWRHRLDVRDQDLDYIIVLHQFSAVLRILAGRCKGFQKVLLAEGVRPRLKLGPQDFKKQTFLPQLMNDILTLREHLECLGGLIHYQGGVGHQDLFGQDLDRVLGAAYHVLHALNKQLSLMSVIEILVFYQVRLGQHLLEDRIILCVSRDLPHGEYLLMGGLICDEGVEKAQAEEGNLVIG